MIIVNPIQVPTIYIIDHYIKLTEKSTDRKRPTNNLNSKSVDKNNREIISDNKIQSQLIRTTEKKPFST